MGHSELYSTGKKCSTVSCPHRERPTVGSIAAVYSQHAQQCGAQVCPKVHYRHSLYDFWVRMLNKKTKTPPVWGGKSTLVWCGPQMDALTQNPQEFCPFGPLYGIAIEEPTMGCPQKGALKPTVGFPWPHIPTVHLKWPTVWPHRHVSWGANSLKSPSVWISSSHLDHDYLPKGIKLLPCDWLIREVEQAYLIKWQFPLFMFFLQQAELRPSKTTWEVSQSNCGKTINFGSKMRDRWRHMTRFVVSIL